MKKSLLLITSVCALFMVSSCVNLAKVQKYRPVKVQTAGDYMTKTKGAVDVAFDVSVPYVYTNWHTGLRFYPVFEGANGEKLELPPAVVEGVQHEVFNERMAIFKPACYDGIDSESRKRYSWELHGTDFSYKTTVAYEPWLKGATAYVDIYADAYTEEVFLGRHRIGGLLYLDDFIVFSPDRRFYYSGSPENSRVVTGGDSRPVADGVIFKAASAKLEAGDDADRAFREYFKAMAADPELRDYSVSVFVSNSPEGSLAYNRELGQRRVNSLRDYLTSVGVAAEKCTVVMEDEGWAQLITMLPSLELKNRAAIEEIIRTTDDLDQRERLIRRKHYADYCVIRDRVYPKLRRGDISLTATYKGQAGKSYKHTYNTLDGNANTFVMLDGSEVNITALHNSMLDAVKQGDDARALEYADAIPNNVPCAMTLYNKASVLTKANRTDEAKALLKRAKAIPQARYNLGLLQLQDSQWNAAAANFEGFSDINTAIARLYTGDNTRALDDLILLGKSPERDYLLAIAYARTGNDEKALACLSSAVESSPELRAKAACEPDFYRLTERNPQQ